MNPSPLTLAEGIIATLAGAGILTIVLIAYAALVIGSEKTPEQRRREDEEQIAYLRAYAQKKRRRAQARLERRRNR